MIPESKERAQCLLLGPWVTVGAAQKHPPLGMAGDAKPSCSSFSMFCFSPLTWASSDTRPSVAADHFKMSGAALEHKRRRRGNSIPVTRAWERAGNKQLCKSKRSGSDLFFLFWFVFFSTLNFRLFFSSQLKKKTSDWISYGSFLSNSPRKAQPIPAPIRSQPQGEISCFAVSPCCTSAPSAISRALHGFGKTAGNCEKATLVV